MDFSAKPEWGLIKINKLDKHQVEKSDPLKKNWCWPINSKCFDKGIPGVFAKQLKWNIKARKTKQ